MGSEFNLDRWSIDFRDVHLDIEEAKENYDNLQKMLRKQESDNQKQTLKIKMLNNCIEIYDKSNKLLIKDNKKQADRIKHLESKIDMLNRTIETYKLSNKILNDENEKLKKSNSSKSAGAFGCGHGEDWTY